MNHVLSDIIKSKVPIFNSHSPPLELMSMASFFEHAEHIGISNSSIVEVQVTNVNSRCDFHNQWSSLYLSCIIVQPTYFSSRVGVYILCTCKMIVLHSCT